MHAVNDSNPWLASVEAGRDPLPAWAAALIATALAAGVVWLTGPAGRAAAALVERAFAAAPTPWPALAGAAVSEVLTFAPLLLAAILACAIARRPAWLPERGPARALAVGVVVGACGFAFSVGMAALAGAVRQGDAGPTGVAALGGVAAGLVLIAFQAASEEVYFRGWLQPALCARWGAWPGLAVTAILFAGLHLVGGARSSLTLVNLLLGGLMFGLLALRSGGLWAPFGAHLAWNWIESCGLGLEPNPGLGPTGSVVDLDLGGPALWSGGIDTMNGSLGATLVLAALVLGLAVFGPSPSAAPEARRSGLAL